MTPRTSDLYSQGAIVNLAASWVGLVVQLVEDGKNVYRWFNPRLFIQVMPSPTSSIYAHTHHPSTLLYVRRPRCQWSCLWMEDGNVHDSPAGFIVAPVLLRLHPHRCSRGHRRPAPFTWRPTRPPSWHHPHQPSHPQTAATPQSNPNEGEIHFEAQAITLLQTTPRCRPSSAHGQLGQLEDSEQIHITYAE